MTRRSFLPPRPALVAALASAALFFLSFPPIPLVVPVLVCLVPVAIGTARMADAGRPLRDGIQLGWWFGLLAFGSTLYWIAIALSLYTKLAILGYVGALFVMAALSAGAVGTLFAARRATHLPLVLLLPVTWVAWEKLTEVLPQLGFPWLPLGLSLTTLPVLAQSVDVSGVHGGSFWIGVVNGILADMVLARGRWPRAPRRTLVAPLSTVAAILVVTAGYGMWRMRSVELRDVAPIGVVQPNVPQEDKWQAENRANIVGMLTAGTRALLDRGEPALVVWPEVALPGYLREHPEWRDTLRAIGSAGRTPVLFGVLDLEWYSSPGEPPDYDYFNAAMLTDSTGEISAQPATRKQHLVPVVERVPFLNPRWFGDLKYFGGYGRGNGAVVYALPWGRFGVLICYESIFPSQSRALRQNGADLLLNITNDAWFGRSIAPWQHQAHMMLRAIETRAGVVRSANTGISSYIDPLGRAHGETGLFVPAAPVYRAQTTDATSPYMLLGDWVGWGSIVASGVAVMRRRRRKPAPDAEPDAVEGKLAA